MKRETVSFLAIFSIVHRDMDSMPFTIILCIVEVITHPHRVA